jgi:maltooligosyltrehalose trehalohydrolase
MGDGRRSFVHPSDPMTPTARGRRLPLGAEPLGGGVDFRVWAPKRERVAVALPDRGAIPLEPEGNGYFSRRVDGLGPGALYRYDVGEGSFPDPASRFQPEGPHGPSEVVDPAAFPWSDAAWRGAELTGHVVYELHVGTFTREGTFAAAERELAELAELGVTLVELMPVADFPGRFGWGYDGVNLFAPSRLYGRPDDLRRFVDRAHALGIGVLLDVVYNHLGPDGNYLRQFSDSYFTDRYQTAWGEALNFDGPGSEGVRTFYESNAAYWIDEFHLDGLRLDATNNIYDRSREHVLAAIARRVRAAARGRATWLVAENEEQPAELVRGPDDAGYGLDAVWNDDYHHSARVALTGHRRAFFGDHRGTAQELLSAVKWGYLYQGQRHGWFKRRRGSAALDVEPARFVHYLENHDQVANTGNGQRLWTLSSPGRHRALTALTLLAPATPLLFQGQEFSSSKPFLFFADHQPDLAKLVRKGRAAFMAQFANLAGAAMQSRLHDPADPAAFERCKLDFAERERHAEAYALHKDLIALRKSDPTFRTAEPRRVDGALLNSEAFLVRWLRGGAADRLLLVNLGADLDLPSCAEPLLAPPSNRGWTVIWSSEDPRYGGQGHPPIETDDGWLVPGESAVVLAPA